MIEIHPTEAVLWCDGVLRVKAVAHVPPPSDYITISITRNIEE